MGTNGKASSNTNGDVTIGNENDPTKIKTNKKENGVCHDDSVPTVKVQTIDELHLLQRKKSAPSTPVKGTQATFAIISEQERQKQQLHSIR